MNPLINFINIMSIKFIKILYNHKEEIFIVTTKVWNTIISLSSRFYMQTHKMTHSMNRQAHARERALNVWAVKRRESYVFEIV